MKYRTLLPIIILQIIFYLPVLSQVKSENIYSFLNQINSGLQQFFVSGIEYQNPNPGAEGNPFLSSGIFIPSDISFRGVRFSNVMLNYDVYNQKFVLNYKNSFGGDMRVILLDEYVDSIYLGKLLFIPVNIDSIKIQYFNVQASAKKLKLLISYKKLYQISSGQSQSNYHFSDLIKTFYLMKEDRIYKISSLSQIKKYLTPDENMRFKEFRRGHRIRLKKSSSYDLQQFLNYLNS